MVGVCDPAGTVQVGQTLQAHVLLTGNPVGGWVLSY